MREADKKMFKGIMSECKDFKMVIKFVEAVQDAEYYERYEGYPAIASLGEEYEIYEKFQHLLIWPEWPFLKSLENLPRVTAEPPMWSWKMRKTGDKKSYRIWILTER